MEKYSCAVCRQEFDLEETQKCPRCGFQIWGLADDSPESKAAEAERARRYRREHWANGKVMLRVYSHAFTDESCTDISCTGEEEVFLGMTRELAVGEIRWLEEKFARLTGDCTLRLRITQEDAENGYMLRVKNPGLRELWQLGLCRKAEDRFALCVGSPENYSESESFVYPPQE